MNLTGKEGLRMDRDKLKGLAMIGGVCCVVVGGVGLTAAFVVKHVAGVIDSVIDHCVPLVDSLAKRVLDSDKE